MLKYAKTKSKMMMAIRWKSLDQVAFNRKYQFVINNQKY